MNTLCIRFEQRIEHGQQTEWNTHPEEMNAGGHTGTHASVHAGEHTDTRGNTTRHPCGHQNPPGKQQGRVNSYSGACWNLFHADSLSLPPLSFHGGTHLAEPGGGQARPVGRTARSEVGGTRVAGDRLSTLTGARWSDPTPERKGGRWVGAVELRSNAGNAGNASNVGISSNGGIGAMTGKGGIDGKGPGR